MENITNNVQRTKYDEFYTKFINKEDVFPLDDLLEFLYQYSVLETKEFDQLTKILDEVTNEVYKRMEAYDKKRLKL